MAGPIVVRLLRRMLSWPEVPVRPAKLPMIVPWMSAQEMPSTLPTPMFRATAPSACTTLPFFRKMPSPALKIITEEGLHGEEFLDGDIIARVGALQSIEGHRAEADVSTRKVIGLSAEIVVVVPLLFDVVSPSTVVMKRSPVLDSHRVAVVQVGEVRHRGVEVVHVANAVGRLDGEVGDREVRLLAGCAVHHTVADEREGGVVRSRDLAGDRDRARVAVADAEERGGDAIEFRVGSSSVLAAASVALPRSTAQPAVTGRRVTSPLFAEILEALMAMRSALIVTSPEFVYISQKLYQNCLFYRLSLSYYSSFIPVFEYLIRNKTIRDCRKVYRKYRTDII